jgi:hypothetical protein
MRNILSSRLLSDKEVEHCSIMPHVKIVVGQWSEKNVSYFPDNANAVVAQSLLCSLDGAGSNVKDSDSGEATSNEIVNKRRIATADIKELAVTADAGP